MTREEELDWLYRLRSEIYVYMPKEWLISMNNALDMAIKALEQEPTTKNDLVLIHTEGLDEGIRCAMCTNSMKSDRGCDGGCVVNKDMYKAVMDTIEKHIQPTTKNDLGVDCINKADFVKKLESETIGLQSWQKALIYQVMDDCHSVTPQEPCDKCEVGNPCLYCKHEFEAKTGHWIKMPIGFKCSNCNELEDRTTKFCPNCGCCMVESQESEE